MLVARCFYEQRHFKEALPYLKVVIAAEPVAVIEDLAKEFGGEAFILPTVYSPLALAHQTIGRGNHQNFKKFVEEDPKAFGKALIFVALGESIALYGLVIAIMILNKI